MLCLVKKLNSNFQFYSNSSDIFIITIVITMTIIIINTYNLTAGQYCFGLLYYYFLIKRKKGDIERLLIY